MKIEIPSTINQTKPQRDSLVLSSPEVLKQLSGQGSKDSSTRLIPITDWNKYHPWPPLGGLRHMIFHGRKTGFDRCTIKIGRRRLIDEKKFFEFIEEQRRKEMGA